MQAVILAAGKSTRTYPLTLTKPKPLLKVANKAVLQRNLEQLDGLADEVIIIVGYKKELIKTQFKNKFNKIKIRYIEQKQQLGTYHALLMAKKYIKDRFIVLMGDDLYSRKDIENCLKYSCSILTKRIENPLPFGVVVKKGPFLRAIKEKPKRSISNLVNCALYVLDKRIFDIKVEKSERNEFELIAAVNELAKTRKIRCVLSNGYWMPLPYSWSLLDANKFFVDKIEKSEIRGEVEKNVTVKGNIIVGKNTRILNGTYIEGNIVIGENCKIGPNCYLRGSTSIGDNCHIGQAVEIKNSIIGDNAAIPHLSYIGDSIIGDNTNLGAGTITANLKHDNSNVKSVIKEELIDTGRRKLGAIIADNVHTGINTSIYPGRKIWPNKTTLPGEIVKEDIV